MTKHKSRNARVLKLIVWGFTALLALVLIPMAVASVWVPSCSSCHNSGNFVAETKAHSHAGVACISCHGGEASGARWRFRQVVMFEMILPVFKAGSMNAAVVNNTQCLSCHVDTVSDITTSNGIKIYHSECAQGSCTDCHSTVAHGVQSIYPRSYDMNNCLTCHSVNIERVGVATCETCHTENHSSAGNTEFRMTHGENWKTGHALGNFDTCGACHIDGFCAKCHGVGYPHKGNFIASHASFVKDPQQKCDSCHKNQKFCDNCHGTEMPHPETFLKAHSGIAKNSADPDCLRCHTRSDCQSCHAAHAHPGGAGTPKR